jgi:hypothetical protein
MILNETYDTILERLNNKYGIGIMNEGLFSKRRDEKRILQNKKYCKYITEKYNKWIKNPYKLSDGEDIDILIIAKWNNVSTNAIINKIISCSNLYNTNNFTDDKNIINKIGSKVYVLLSNDDYSIIISKNKKAFEIYYNYGDSKISEWNLSKIDDDNFYFGQLSKDEYFNYINE